MWRITLYLKIIYIWMKSTAENKNSYIWMTVCYKEKVDQSSGGWQGVVAVVEPMRSILSARFRSKWIVRFHAKSKNNVLVEREVKLLTIMNKVSIFLVSGKFETKAFLLPDLTCGKVTYRLIIMATKLWSPPCFKVMVEKGGSNEQRTNGTQNQPQSNPWIFKVLCAKNDFLVHICLPGEKGRSISNQEDLDPHGFLAMWVLCWNTVFQQAAMVILLLLRGLLEPQPRAPFHVIPYRISISMWGNLKVFS